MSTLQIQIGNLNVELMVFGVTMNIFRVLKVKLVDFSQMVSFGYVCFILKHPLVKTSVWIIKTFILVQHVEARQVEILKRKMCIVITFDVIEKEIWNPNKRNKAWSWRSYGAFVWRCTASNFFMCFWEKMFVCCIENHTSNHGTGIHGKAMLKGTTHRPWQRVGVTKY